MSSAIPDPQHSRCVETPGALGNVAHETRGAWTVAMIRLARGGKAAIDCLHEIAAVYRGLGMPGEAGYVNVDITAELLEREEWTDAEILARELVTLFTAAGVTLASVNALDYLRRAVENREATADTVRYIAGTSRRTPIPGDCSSLRIRNRADVSNR